MNVAILAVLVIVYQRPAPQNNTQANADQAKLEEILEKTSEYCRRLENAVFDFVCLEEITEKIRQSPEFRTEFPRRDRDSLGIPQLRAIYQLRRE